MAKSPSKVTLHMVSSLDGFIAKEDNSVSWMHSTDHYEKGVILTEEDIAAYLEGIDCYVMGSLTYQHALELGWPYGDVPVLVLTRGDHKSEKESVEFYDGDLKMLIENRLRPKYSNIWMVGGAKLAKDFIQKRLVDDIIVSIMPIILGSGTLFFDYIGQEYPLHLKDVTAYQDGMVELTYEVKDG